MYNYYINTPLKDKIKIIEEAYMNRTGTYVAFDGLGQTNPSKSDFRYYATLKAWTANRNIEFRFVDSHEKTYAVRDTSTKATLYSRIRQRLGASKNMLVIISQNTRYTGSVLTYEIAQAIDVYKLPLIIAYPGHSVICNVNELSNLWPKALAERIDTLGIEAIHIAFEKEPILNAINRFTVNGEHLTSGKNYYSRESYIEWGLVQR